MLCRLELGAHSSGNAIEDKLTDDGFRLRWRGGGGEGGLVVVVLGGDATSVSPKAQSPNGCDEQRGKHPPEPARRHSDRGGETGRETQIQMDREMEGDGDRLTECETRRWKREREGKGVVKKMGLVNLGEQWDSINILLLAFTGHCPLSQHVSERYTIQ